MKPPRLSLSIDRLVLHGVAPAQREAVVAALAAELERQLAMPGAAAALGADRHVASLPAQPVPARDTRPATLGTAGARGLVGALTK